MSKKLSLEGEREMKHTEHQSSFPYLHPSMWLYLPETSQFLGGAFKGNRERPISWSVSFFFFFLLHSQTVGTTTATTERVSIGELSLEVGEPWSVCVCTPFCQLASGCLVGRSQRCSFLLTRWTLSGDRVRWTSS